MHHLLPRYGDERAKSQQPSAVISQRASLISPAATRVAGTTGVIFDVRRSPFLIPNMILRCTCHMADYTLGAEQGAYTYISPIVMPRARMQTLL